MAITEIVYAASNPAVFNRDTGTPGGTPIEITFKGLQASIHTRIPKATGVIHAISFDGNHMLGVYGSPQPGEFTPQPLLIVGDVAYTMGGQLVGTMVVD